MIQIPDLPPGFRLVRFDQIDSTNEEARRQAGAGQGQNDVLALSAAEQTAGRGRRGRVWTSPRGNLHLSLLLTPGRPVAEAAQLSFVTAIALADALGELVPGLAVACKWPNDLLVEGRKVSGILLETAGPQMIVGLGVNLRHAPDPALYPATALIEHGYDGDEARALAAILRHFARWLAVWRQDGFAPVRTAWLARAHGLDGQVVVRLPDRELTGTFSGLDESGALLLITPDGNHKTIHAGDVFFGSGS